MATFYFQLPDHDGIRPTEIAYDFDTADAAVEEARTALSEMAANGLPISEYSMLSVEVFDENRKPVREIRLVLEEIDKSAFATASPKSEEAEHGH